jgi:hypothetical protein
MDLELLSICLLFLLSQPVMLLLLWHLQSERNKSKILVCVAVLKYITLVNTPFASIITRGNKHNLLFFLWKKIPMIS